MKKLFYAIVLILSIGILAVSCQKNDPANQSIIGTWKVVSVESEYVSDISVGCIFTFTENTLTITNGSFGGTISYNRNGNKLTFNDRDFYPLLTIVSVTSSTLELKYVDAGYEDDYEVFKLQKVQ